MTLFSLAKKNVTGNFISYLLYILSMIFCVVIYYTFVSIQYSPEVQMGIESSNSLLNIFIGASVILILFVAIFIFYSNSFFTKKRKKEVGLFSLLGMRKKNIGKMLFYENMLMSVVAVMIGIVLGTFLSKLFTMLLLRMLDSAVEVGFGISPEAIINTSIVFSIITLCTSFNAYRLIYRFKLIELFQAEKEGEQAPKASLAPALLAILLIGFSYWLGFKSPSSKWEMMMILGSYLASIVLGTYLLFRFLTIYILRFAQKRKSSYYRGINIIGISQLLYRIKGNARSLTIIALLSAITISAISVGYSFYYTNEVQAKKEVPFSYSYFSPDKEIGNQIDKIIVSDSLHPVIGQIEIPVLNVEGEVTNPLLQDYLKEGPVKLVSETTYNKALEILNQDGIVHLSGNEAVGIQPLLTEYSSADYEGHTVTLKTPESEEKIRFSTMAEDRIMPWSYPDFGIVISDKLFSDLTKQLTPVSIASYKVEDEKTTKETSDELQKFAEGKNQLSTYYETYRGGLESASLNLFVLGFLSLVFLAATGSIIYFKQLTEAHEDKGRYEILHKIGVSKKEVSATIRMQTLFVFGLPLIIGMVHGAVILKMCSNIYSALIGTNLTVPIAISLSGYIVIYLFYYLLTINSVKKIVIQ
ncbi:hypothetical protein AM499_19885 [Bacillus sp. FJAT-22090]|uniref:ABC transporter permease n=1 Tax=Bacillus sp. FJAT-22090 TaxID=1581038 RepID=UPI0006AE2BA0|nr:ABC transporter permease [Bacillus sp. FJAT-22090]ALC87810.1 hypothetical protein AM499_19885 [Bacillus sp. FJAT-22090]